MAAKDGTKEVGAAITASTLTTVSVFIPVVFITGLIGELFTEFALTISFSLFASLVVALTVVPMLASRLLKAPKKSYINRRHKNSWIKRIDKGVRWSLQHRGAVIIITLVCLGISIFGLTTVGTQFLPSTDEGFFSVRIKLENGAALTETEKVVAALEDQLKKEQEVDTFVSLIGTTQEGTFRGTMNANEGELYIKMKELEKRERTTFKFVDDVKDKLVKGAVAANPTAELSFIMQSSTGSSPHILSFSVRDTNPERLTQSVDTIFNRLKNLKEVNELTTDLMERVDEIQISVDREDALRNGLVPAQIARIVNDVTRGSRAAQMVSETGEIRSIFVQYDRKITSNLEHLKGLLVKKPKGGYVTLGEVSKFEVKTGPVDIQRINQQGAVQFTLKYKTTTNLGAISKKIEQEIDSLHLPEESEIVFSGEKELLDSSINELILAVILAVVFIYIVMAAQFESLKYPFVIMFSVPLMVIGVALALTSTLSPISLTVIIGVIVLAGIVVNNAIVIVDFINQKKKAEWSPMTPL